MRWNESNPCVKTARTLSRVIRDAGHIAYWVGGCVRDTLLGIDPQDIDIASDAPPEKIQSLFPRTVAMGARFGVVLVMDGDVETEVATFRRDGAYEDGRHPSSVSFGSAEEDAWRRDFTINALFYDPFEDSILDFVGGSDDLGAGILRAIGDANQRFEEDALRLLRAVRFVLRFGLVVDPQTLAAIQANSGKIKRVSPERIREEMSRILTGPNRMKVLPLLDLMGLLEPILPEVAAMKGVEQPQAFHPEGDVFEHTSLVLSHLPQDASACLAWGALLHDVGKPVTFEHSDRIRFNLHHSVGAEMADRICRRFHFSNLERRAIADLVGQHMQFMHVREMRPARLRRMLGAESFADHLALHRADCLASHGDLRNVEFCEGKIREYGSESAGPILPSPLLNGHDLIAMGYKPGPAMGQMLRAIREAQLNGEIQTSEDALVLLGIESRLTEADKDTKERG